MSKIASKEELADGKSFVKEKSGSCNVSVTANENVVYDVVDCHKTLMEKVMK